MTEPQRQGSPDTRTATKLPRTPRPRHRHEVENSAFAAFVKRIIRAHAKRVAAGDVTALGDLADLAVLVDEQLHITVRYLRSAEGGAYSWAQIGSGLGITRQSAQARFKDAGGVRRPGGQPGYLR